MDRIVDDDVALPTNRILDAWVNRLQEVVVVGIDTYGKIIVAGSGSGDRSVELLGRAAAEIKALSDESEAA